MLSVCPKPPLSSTAADGAAGELVPTTGGGQVCGLHVAPPLSLARVGEAEVQVRWSAGVLPRAVIQGRWRLSIKVSASVGSG